MLFQYHFNRLKNTLQTVEFFDVDLKAKIRVSFGLVFEVYLVVSYSLMKPDERTRKRGVFYVPLITIFGKSYFVICSLINLHVATFCSIKFFACFNSEICFSKSLHFW